MRRFQRSLTTNSSLAFYILCCTGQVPFDLIFIFFLLCLCMYLRGSCAIITQKFDSLKLRYMQLGFQINSSSGRILLQITANISLSSEVNLGKKESDTQKAKNVVSDALLKEKNGLCSYSVNGGMKYVCVHQVRGQNRMSIF